MFNVKLIGADEVKDSAGLAKELLASAVACRLYSGGVYNTGALTRYFMIFNSASAAADGQTPRLLIPVPTKSFWSFDFPDGLQFGTGVYMCLSSTETTKTLVGTNDGLFYCSFRKTE
jgi:hypothetical protein